jgi:hypothetical protein
MKNLLFSALLAVTMTLALPAQTKHTTAVSHTQTPKVEISHYMREMGLMYMGILDKDEKLSPVEQLESHTGESLDMIESEIKINITTKADAAYLDILRLARSTQTALMLVKLAELHRRNYEAVCVGHNGQPPLIEQGSALCIEPKPDKEQERRAQWYPACWTDATFAYQTGELTGIRCNSKTIFSRDSDNSADNNKPVYGNGASLYYVTGKNFLKVTSVDVDSPNQALLSKFIVAIEGVRGTAPELLEKINAASATHQDGVQIKILLTDSPGSPEREGILKLTVAPVKK